MAILNSTGLSILVSYIKSYVNNQISSNFTTGTAAKATADASGNVISDTYATKTYANTAINTAVNNLSSSSNFLKSASVDGNTLTITKGNDSTVTFTKPGSPSDLTMANYVKPSSTSAISTSDTLTQAIGKLEKALDEKVDSDDESVATFDSNDKLVFPDGTKIWIS